MLIGWDLDTRNLDEAGKGDPPKVGPSSPGW